MQMARAVITGVAVTVTLIGAGSAEARVAEAPANCTQIDPNHWGCEFVATCSDINAMAGVCAAIGWFYGWPVEGVECNEWGGGCLFHTGPQ